MRNKYIIGLLASVALISARAQTNNTIAFVNVINVKAFPYSAKGDGVTDDWVAIQSAITRACLSTNSPVSVYIPAGTYRLTNTIALTTQTNGGNTTGDTSISQLFGDGARQTFLMFTNRDGNGIEFRLVSGDNRHLSNFTLHDLAIFGPSIAGDTNTTGNGFFFGFSPELAYTGDAPGWHNTIRDCMIEGWRRGIAITNSVFFSIRNCNIRSNILNSVFLAHADTTLLQNNNYGFPVETTNDIASVVVERDSSGNAGAGVLSIGGECGSSSVFAYVNGGTFKQVGGNFERNESVLVASNFATTTFEGCTVQQQYTNATFVFRNGGASRFFTRNMSGLEGVSNLFNQIPGPDITGELPVRHDIDSITTNGWFNGVPRFYRMISFQTPRFKQDFQLANVTLLTATALTPLATSPAPFNCSDGLNINNNTGQWWIHLPSGLGNAYNQGNLESVRWTMLIQGGVGATNATANLTTILQRNDPVNGGVTESSPSFVIPGISNTMCKVFTWTNGWTIPTSMANQRFVRFQLQTTNQIYVIGLSCETIDY